jgi:hypothetical protein
VLRSGDTVSNTLSRPRVKYRIIQEEGSMFWEAITAVIVGRKVLVHVCLILICYRENRQT